MPGLWAARPDFDLGVFVADGGGGGDRGGADFPPGVALGCPTFIRVDLHDDDGGFGGGFGALERRGQFGGGGDGFRQRAHRGGMGGEIDEEGVGHCGAIGDEVVEAVLPGVVLQLVDDGKAAIVENEDDQLFLCENRGIDVGVHQEIAAVSDKDDGIAVGFGFRLCDACAPAACDFVSHAGEAEFDIDGADAEGAPVGGHLGGQAACGGDDAVARVAERVHHADRLGVGIGAVAGGHVGGDVGIPDAAFGLGFCHPVGGGAVGREGFGEGFQSEFGVTHDGEGKVLGGVMAACVQADEAGVRGEDGPRSGGEILQAGADGEDDIGGACDGVGAV